MLGKNDVLNVIYLKTKTKQKTNYYWFNYCIQNKKERIKNITD